jgi:putative ABC transport system permease protein
MSRSGALVGLAWRLLWHHRRRATLALAGVALAVLLAIVITALAYGVFTTGGEAIAWINRDLWVTGGRLGFAPGSITGIDNPIHGAHTVSADLAARPEITAAQPIALTTVYVSPNQSSFTTTIGVGGVGTQNPDVSADQALVLNDSHYGNGSYTGPRTREAIIDPRTAERFDVGVNDTLYIGGTINAARNNEFRVIAVNRRFSTFLGAPTVAVPLSELQAVTGTTGTDPAAFIGVTLAPTASATAVERDIEREYPDLTVRTNDEQVQQIVGKQTAVVVGVIALVVLAVVAGLALVVNVLVTLVRSQRRELAAAQAIGIRRRSLLTAVLVQGLLIGLAGGLLGALVSIPAIDALNVVLADISGFAALATRPWWVLPAGVLFASVMGVLGAVAAGWQLGRLSPVSVLR